jgi:hypothetical protein
MTKVLRNYILPLLLLLSGGMGCRYMLTQEHGQPQTTTTDVQDHSCFLSDADVQSPVIDSWHSGMSYRERSKAITEKNEEEICPSVVQKKPPRIVITLGAVYTHFLNYHYFWKAHPLLWIRPFQSSYPRYLILQVFRL